MDGIGGQLQCQIRSPHSIRIQHNASPPQQALRIYRRSLGANISALAERCLLKANDFNVQ
jgi:hypothetical protein